MTTITYENQTAETGKFVDSDNNVIDVQEFLESGQVLLTATASAAPVVPVAEATTPKYKNLAPWVGKFINSADEIIDLINFLTSGQVKVQVSGAAMDDATYITNTNETASLPNSKQLLGTSNQINVLNGLLSLPSTLIFPGTISFGGSSATVNDIDNTGTSFLSTELMTGLGTQLAIANAIDAGVSFRGGWDASGGLFPTTGGTGAGGAVEAGNWWYITTGGTLSGQDVPVGDWITALVNAPGQTGSNWLISAQGVNKVFNRIGDVVAERGDYSVDKITNGYNNAVSWVFSDFTAAVPPTLDTDATLGYTVGSLYTDTLTGYSYVCKDAGEGAAIWEKMAPTSASYASNSLQLNVNGNTTNTEIVPLCPEGVTYVAANGDDGTGRVNESAFPFYTLQAGATALNALPEKIGHVLSVYPRGDVALYDNLTLTGFNGWEIRGVGGNVVASDLFISDDGVSAAVNGGTIANVYFNNLSISNFNDNVDGVTFQVGAFNDYVLENESSATNGINNGSKFIDVEFVGSIIYFPAGYAKQINVITETYIGCKFASDITLNGTTTNLRFIHCQNIPTITYANGATSSQVTVVGVNQFNNRAGNVLPADNDYPYNYITGLPDTATSGKLMRGTGSAWAETTATYPNTVANNDLLRGSATNVVSPLSTQTSSALTTSEFGALRWTSLSLGQVPMGSFTSGVNAGTITGGTGMQTNFSATNITIELQIPVIASRGGTGLTSVGPAGNLLTSNGTSWVSSAPTKNSYGKITLLNGTTGVVSPTLSTTAAEMRGMATSFSLDSNSSSDFSMSSDGRLQYTGAQTKTFIVFGSIATGATPGSGLNAFEVRKNGVAVTNNNPVGGTIYGQLGPIFAIIPMATNDYLSGWFRIQGGTGTAAIWNIQISAFSLNNP